ATKYRFILNAATMLNQSKTVFQAEIDSACELIDFFRFNTYFAMKIYERQPNSSPGIWNVLEHRPLEGFIFAVTPFNFTSIAGNLPTAPVIMGNVSLWKPASSAVYSAYYLMLLFKEAGVPDGVINFIPGSGASVGTPVLQSPDLAGIHFTGSTPTFHTMWKTVGTNIDKYKTYPRIVGETGGKDFIFVHSSADVDVVKVAIVRGAFEYQGQKCSAASRAYIPESIWSKLKDKLLITIKELKMGTVEDFTNFTNAIIDKNAFDSIVSYIEYAKKSSDAEILIGGNYDDSVGYYIEPTVILTTDPKFKTMEEEIFGPVITIYIYKDNEFEKTLHLCDETSPYALTGS
ncbi:MAG: aldehyde dehydrogenase family protein, partial [Candidatus Cloacimonetes bacterium]|nr:aldehyde dehydrogenase family protein [Candidatus Cloacimonadota bacterium]